MSGTSQAAPLVTFAAALLYSEGLSVADVRNRLRATVSCAPQPLSDDVETAGRLDIERALSIHDDIVTLRNQSEPLVGRIVEPACVPVGQPCHDLKRVARFRGSSDGDPDGRATVWLFSTRGELIQRTPRMPSGGFKFQLDATTSIDVKWADVTDVILARRAR